MIIWNVVIINVFSLYNLLKLSSGFSKFLVSGILIFIHKHGGHDSIDYKVGRAHSLSHLLERVGL